MLDWVNHGADRVDAAAQGDGQFRALMEALERVEEAHGEILQRLSPREREIVLEYEDLLVELEHRKTQLAYYLNGHN